MITLIIGPMFSSKSTTLLSFERRFIILKKKYLCINHSFDTRYNDEGKITTIIPGLNINLCISLLTDEEKNNLLSGLDPNTDLYTQNILIKINMINYIYTNYLFNNKKYNDIYLYLASIASIKKAYQYNKFISSII